MNKASSQITLEQVEGRPVNFMYGYPIRIVDVLGVAESQLT